MTVIDTPRGIAFAQLLARRGALRIEVNTGLRHSRGSVMKVCKTAYGIHRNTKKAVLAHLDALIDGIQTQGQPVTAVSLFHILVGPADGDHRVVTYTGRDRRSLMTMFCRGVQVARGEEAL